MKRILFCLLAGILAAGMLYAQDEAETDPFGDGMFEDDMFGGDMIEEMPPKVSPHAPTCLPCQAGGRHALPC